MDISTHFPIFENLNRLQYCTFSLLIKYRFPILIVIESKEISNKVRVNILKVKLCKEMLQYLSLLWNSLLEVEGP